MAGKRDGWQQRWTETDMNRGRILTETEMTRETICYSKKCKIIKRMILVNFHCMCANAAKVILKWKGQVYF